MQSVGPDVHPRMVKRLISVIILFFNPSLKHCGHGGGS